jgi:molybdenum cofactor cytidylyltransferase
MPADKPIAGVVLAAGSSVRMGGPNKMLLELNGEPMVRRTVRCAIEAGLSPVIVVLGHEADRVREALSGLACTPVVNHDHARGAGSSLRFGVSQLCGFGDVPAVALLLGDMPFVTTAMLQKIVTLYRETGARLVISRYGADVEAPPHVFDRSLFMELLAGDDQRCAKAVVQRHMSDAAIAAWPESALRDVDKAADYEAVRAELAR